MSGIIFCLFIIGASVYFYVDTLSFPEIVGYEKMGPGFWPQLLLIGIVIFAVIIIVDEVLKRKKAPFPRSQPKTYDSRGVAKCGGILFFTMLFIPYLGYITASFLGAVAAVHALGERKKSVTILYSAIMVALIYIFFAKFLFVPIPRGVSVFRDLSYYLY